MHDLGYVEHVQEQIAEERGMKRHSQNVEQRAGNRPRLERGDIETQIRHRRQSQQRQHDAVDLECPGSADKCRVDQDDEGQTDRQNPNIPNRRVIFKRMCLQSYSYRSVSQDTADSF